MPCKTSNGRLLATWRDYAIGPAPLSMHARQAHLWRHPTEIMKENYLGRGELTLKICTGSICNNRIPVEENTMVGRN